MTDDVSVVDEMFQAFASSFRAGTVVDADGAVVVDIFAAEIPQLQSVAEGVVRVGTIPPDAFAC